jgi:hypothetical protein
MYPINIITLIKKKRVKLIPLHIINQEIISLSALDRTQYRRSIGTRTGTHVSAAN